MTRLRTYLMALTGLNETLLSHLRYFIHLSNLHSLFMAGETKFCLKANAALLPIGYKTSKRVYN